MSKKQAFIEFIETIFEEYNIGPDSMSEDVQMYWDVLKSTDEKEKKSVFTDNGKLIMKFLQDNQTNPMWKARDIAEGLFISSRAVSGAIRKLVSDGFVEKVGQNPTIYTLTDKGKTIDINIDIENV